MSRYIRKADRAVIDAVIEPLVQELNPKVSRLIVERVIDQVPARLSTPAVHEFMNAIGNLMWSEAELVIELRKDRPRL